MKAISWLQSMLARHACALVACSSDEARIGVLRAAITEGAARARLETLADLEDAMAPMVCKINAGRHDAINAIQQMEQTYTGQEANGTPPCRSAGDHGRALALHGRCIACEEAAGIPPVPADTHVPAGIPYDQQVEQERGGTNGRAEIKLPHE